MGNRQGVSHTPLRGGNTPNFRTTPPPRLQGEMRERGEVEGGGKGKGEEKGSEGTPKGWLTPPMFQILKNTLVTGVSSQTTSIQQNAYQT